MNEAELRKLDDEMGDAFSDQNVDLILSLCSTDILMLDYGEEPIRGQDDCREYLNRLFAPMSGGKHTHIKRIFGDNQVFGELERTITNTGDLAMPDGSTIPATGRSVNMRFGYYTSINDAGEIEEIRGYPDIMAMMGQLGLMG